MEGEGGGSVLRLSSTQRLKVQPSPSLCCSAYPRWDRCPPPPGGTTISLRPISVPFLVKNTCTTKQTRFFRLQLPAETSNIRSGVNSSGETRTTEGLKHSLQITKTSTDTSELWLWVPIRDVAAEEPLEGLTAADIKVGTEPGGQQSWSRSLGLNWCRSDLSDSSCSCSLWFLFPQGYGLGPVLFSLFLLS